MSLLLIAYCVTTGLTGATLKNKRHVPNFNPEVYNYPVPNPPPVFDEPPSPPLSDHYGPPIEDNPPQSTYVPPTELKPPQPLPPNEPENDIPDQFLPPHQYLPPNHYLPPPQYGPPLNHQNLVRVSNMSCFDTVTRKFFRATISIPSPYDLPPVVEDGRDDCMVISQNGYLLKVDGPRMTQCGVRYCSSHDRNLCAQIRMPTVKGLKLPEDPLVTLQCRPQETVVEKTQLLRMNPQYT